MLKANIERAGLETFMSPEQEDGFSRLKALPAEAIVVTVTKVKTINERTCTIYEGQIEISVTAAEVHTCWLHLGYRLG